MPCRFYRSAERLFDCIEFPDRYRCKTALNGCKTSESIMASEKPFSDCPDQYMYHNIRQWRRSRAKIPETVWVAHIWPLWDLGRYFFLATVERLLRSWRRITRGRAASWISPRSFPAVGLMSSCLAQNVVDGESEVVSERTP